ncbi:Ig-like domain-containing protein [candidate division KSB1 bacterium]|nr:Ig-like domain-containing protein [candidate division KSB1 bacterium]
MIRRYIYYTGLLVLGMLACAKQLPPSGGPVDKQSPEIMDARPAPNSTHVPPDTDVELTFSERVTRTSVAKSIFISPRPEKRVNLKWKGKRLIIDFADSLHADRTYVLTIGTDVEDLRRNKMKKSFHLAFSTGDQLDAGRISGRVYGETPQTAMLIGAYLVDGDKHPDPGMEIADYLTQCDEQGVYQFSYLSLGRYRLYAFGDRDADYKYDRHIEKIGIAATELEISDEQLSFENLNFKITAEDTAAPVIKSLRVYDRHHIDIRFNEAMERTDDPRGHFCITLKSSESDTIDIRRLIHSDHDRSRFMVVTAGPMSDIYYDLRIDSLYDMSGNLIDSTYRKYEFQGIALPDTIRPQLISQSISDMSCDVPLDVQLRFVFSEAMNCSTLQDHFMLLDSNRVKYAGEFTWQDPTDFTYVPDRELPGETDYIVHIAADSVYDEFQNSLADTSIDIRFRTLNQDTLSSIMGQIQDEKENATGKIYLYAVQAGAHSVSYKTELDDAGPYKFENILPGVYLINGFRDEDGDQEYTYGRVYPFLPAERFFYYPDSVKVRSKWANEGNEVFLNRY